MPVRARAHDLEGLGDGHEGLALEGAADDVDEGFGQVGEVAQGLVLDLAVFAVAATQEVGAVDLALVGALRGDDVGGSGAGRYIGSLRHSGLCVKRVSDYKNDPQKG
jgi:hypothetical protein